MLKKPKQNLGKLLEKVMEEMFDSSFARSQEEAAAQERERVKNMDYPWHEYLEQVIVN